MKYRVTYPLITQDATRDFATREEAETFKRERINICMQSIYTTMQSANLVYITEVDK